MGYRCHPASLVRVCGFGFDKQRLLGQSDATHWKKKRKNIYIYPPAWHLSRRERQARTFQSIICHLRYICNNNKTFTMAQAIRDTPAGQFLRSVGFGSWLAYPEEVDGFEPQQMSTVAEEVSTPSEDDDLEKTLSKISAKIGTTEGEITTKLSENELADVIVVSFTKDDQGNPRNWSQGKKTWTLTLINTYTFVVYLAASIITPDAEVIMQRYNVSIVVASLGLSMYVVGCKFYH